MFGRSDETVVFPDATVAEKPQSLGGAVMGAVLPEAGLLRNVGKGKLLLIGFAAAVFAAALLLAINWMNGKDAKAGHEGAAKFAAALVHNNPAADADASSFVNGVRAYFGPVSSATMIAGHERGVNAPDNADERTYYVIEMLIQSKRGPAALELDYDNHSLGSDRITSVHELKPQDTPGISDAQRAQLTKAIAARGGHTAGEVELAGATTVTTGVATPKVKIHMPTVAPAATKVPGLDKATKQLKCVQNAHGDVTKIAACTR
jgi:hypothetical protein